MTKKIISLIAIIFLLGTYISSVVYSATTAELNQQKAELENQKNAAENEKSQITEQKSSEQSELETITNELNTLNNEIQELQARLDDLNDSISQKEEEINAKQKEMEEKEALLKKRMVAMYKAGGISYLDVLLGSSNYLDMITSYSALEKITTADTNLINQIATQKTELENAKTELESKKSEVDAVKSQKDAKNVQLSQKQADKQKKISDLSADEQAKQSEIDSYNAAMARVNKELEDAWKKAQEQINGANGGAGLKFDGSFIWPCNNKTVTSTVKYRWGRMHKGIDIAASYESVYASASGYAYNAYDQSGYGIYIMVFHGGNYVSLYGHLSSSKISNGQYVSQGQTIATSGNTGGSTGPHLHFELRNASSMSSFFSVGPLNPLDYLPGGYTLAPGA